MVRTRRGSGVEINQGLQCLNMTQKRKNTRKKVNEHGFDHHHSPLSAPQLTHPEAGCLLSDVLKYHGQNKVTHTYERVPRRAVSNCNSYQSKRKEDNTGKNSSNFQQLRDGTLPTSVFQADIPINVVQSPEAKDLKMHPVFAPGRGGTPNLGNAVFASEQEANPHLGDISRGSNVFHLLGSKMDPTTADVATVGADSVASKVNKDQEKRESDTLVIKSASKATRSLNMTEIAEQTNINDESEVDSQGCDSISVGGYRIQPRYVDLCNSILSKYGDIAANCLDQPVLIRSFNVEYLCFVVEKLQNTEFENITRKELEDMLTHLSYIEGQGVNVSWVKKLVQVIYEANLAVSVLRSSSDAKQLLRTKKSNIQRIEKELEVYGKDYAIKQAELANLKEKIDAANSVLSKEEEVQETETMLSDYKAKLRYVYYEFKPLVRSLT